MERESFSSVRSSDVARCRPPLFLLSLFLVAPSVGQSSDTFSVTHGRRFLLAFRYPFSAVARFEREWRGEARQSGKGGKSFFLSRPRGQSPSFLLRFERTLPAMLQRLAVQRKNDAQHARNRRTRDSERQPDVDESKQVITIVVSNSPRVAESSGPGVGTHLSRGGRGSRSKLSAL